MNGIYSKQDFHSFNVLLACEVGIEKAIILQSIDFWIKKNLANDVNFHDGCYWTYNTSQAYETLFPYLKQKTIARYLLELEANGWLISSKKYNKTAYDRTKWYSLTSLYYDFFAISQNEKSNRQKENWNAQNEKSNRQKENWNAQNEKSNRQKENCYKETVIEPFLEPEKEKSLLSDSLHLDLETSKLSKKETLGEFGLPTLELDAENLALEALSNEILDFLGNKTNEAMRLKIRRKMRENGLLRLDVEKQFTAYKEYITITDTYKHKNYDSFLDAIAEKDYVVLLSDAKKIKQKNFPAKSSEGYKTIQHIEPEMLSEERLYKTALGFVDRAENYESAKQTKEFWDKQLEVLRLIYKSPNVNDIAKDLCVSLSERIKNLKDKSLSESETMELKLKNLEDARRKNRHSLKEN